MSLSKKKILIITLIIILSVIGVMSTGVGVYLNIKKTQDEKPKAADLTISNYTELVNFANRVNSGETFSGKTVELDSNINCQRRISDKYVKQEVPCVGGGSTAVAGGTTYSFDGTFDGKGFAIYGFKLTGGLQHKHYIVHDRNDREYRFYYYSALFVNLGSSAIIRNLKISNWTNSVVESTEGGNWTTSHTHYERGLVSNRETAGTIYQCWVTESSAYSNVSSVTNTMLSGSIINSRGGTITSANTITGISSSVFGGSTGTIWYYHSAYNSGWPKLRVFMDWKTVSFSGTNVSYFSPSSIQIPNDANGTSSSSSSSIDIYGQVVTAYSSFCHYSSVSWTANSVTSYSVKFNPKTIKITLKEQNNTTSTSTTLKTDTKNCGHSVMVEMEPYGSSAKYKSCSVNGNYYAPSRDYYIKQISINNGTSIHEDTEIVIIIERKTYNITFG